MPRFSALLLTVLALGLLPLESPAQSNQFRDTRAHLGVAVGWFTYHGPVDLNFPRSSANFDRVHDPAVVVLGSFPLVGDRFFFRGMVGFTNFDREADPNQVIPRQNQFLTRDLLFFEPEVIMTLTKGSRSRILPYVFTGFGGLVADPYRRRIRVDRPGTGVPGPERSVFHIPVGAGIDLGLSPMLSLFVEGSWRFDLNYVLRNEADYNRHSTSLVMAGLRLGLKNPFRRPVQRPDAPLSPPMGVNPYTPPTPNITLPPPADPQVCTLVYLEPVYFAYDSITLDATARRILDENIEALRLNPQCCVDIVGYTDRDGSGAYAVRISFQRAQAVFEYYVAAGIDPSRLKPSGQGAGYPPCGKFEKGEGPGCPTNRRVESIPLDCARFLNR